MLRIKIPCRHSNSPELLLPCVPTTTMIKSITKSFDAPVTLTLLEIFLTNRKSGFFLTNRKSGFFLANRKSGIFSNNGKKRKKTATSFGILPNKINFFEQRMSGPAWNMKSIFQFNEISQDIQEHLVRVYLTFASALVMVAVGVYADILLSLSGLLSMIGSIGLSLWLATTHPAEESKRMSILAALAFCLGLNLGPLVDLTLAIDPSILISAVLSTTLIFLSFSAAALIAKRREYLFLGGLLSSALSIMLAMSLFNIFFRSAAIASAHLYLGLMVFCAYVIFDTQLIIEKASLGDKDHLMHACQLLIDFVGIFARICIILLRNNNNKQKKRKN